MKTTKPKLAKLLSSLPKKPGIYKMVNEEGRVIYVGKAKDLSKRVKQYFQKNSQASIRTQKLVENTADIQYTVVDTELEALILELNLIKELHPKYNVLLKDDKNYVYIKITEDENFPRIQIVRKIDDKKAKYYGPKTSKHKVEKTFKTLKKVLPFRHCTLDIKALNNKEVEVTHKTIKYPCLDHYIKRCAAPCIANCTKKQYAEIISNVKRFLEGHHEEILKSLHDQMKKLALDKKFEAAAKLRDRVQNIEEITERQKISDPNQKDKDIFNYVLAGDKAFFNLFQIRDGKLINQENFILQAKSIEITDEKALKELLGAFLIQYYEKTTNIPKEILIPHDPSNKKSTESFISKEKGNKVRIITPKIGQKSRLLSLSFKNAKIYADRNKTIFSDSENLAVLKELQKLLKLKKVPKRIECYDISHLSGTDTTGSMIVFENGSAKNSDYRRFKIRTVSKPDDYAALKEVLTRRFGYLEASQDGYTIKKALKKDTKFIKATLKKANIDSRNFDYKSFHVLKKKDKITGFIREKVINDTHLLASLWVSEKERGGKLGHRLLHHAIEKSKAKRIYLDCREELASYYEAMGFQRIKKVPKGLEKEHQTQEAEGDPVSKASDSEPPINEKCESGYCALGTKGVWFAYDKKKRKDSSFKAKPDLIIIDGGKGQLSTAVKTLKKFEGAAGKTTIPVISIAKKKEEIFIPGKKESIKLDRTSPILKLIQRSRDEAHRFAINYNRKLRSKRL